MASLSNTEISRDQLLGIRAACIIGIVVGHSFLIYPFLQGNEWRIPILLLLGGTSAIKDRPLKSTIYFIFKSFYLYVCMWTLFYTVALQIMGSDIYGKYILIDSLPKLLTTHMFINNMHGNLLTLANWFLIPYGIGLIVVSLIRKFITKKQVPSALIAAMFLVFSFYLAEASPSWQTRIIGHALFGSGYLLLGAVLFSSTWLRRFITLPHVVAACLLFSVWMHHAFKPYGMVWSWLQPVTNQWPALIVSLAMVPPLFWLGGTLGRYSAVRYIGANSKHIMMHHIAGFAVINIVVYRLGFIGLEDLHPLKIQQAQYTWPLYLISAVLWSLALAKGSRFLISYFRNLVRKDSPEYDLARG